MSKANGPDGISSAVLKKCAPELAPVLAKLFQISSDTRTVPSEWKTAHAVAVPTKGSKHDPSNYRPILLGPVLFLMFIDNLASHLGNDIHLFADESTPRIAIKITCDIIICAESLQCDDHQQEKKP